MAITAQQVKELRELTDCGIMDCKRALTEADGDIEKAKAWLREKGMAKAEKKASRVAAEGTVADLISADSKSGLIVEVNIETDFAANTPKFKSFVSEVANHIMAKKPADVDALFAQNLASDESKTVLDFQKEAIADIGENTSIRRFSLYEVNGMGSVASYIHAGGKVGVLVEIAVDNDDVINNPTYKQMARDIGMQIAASNPSWVAESDVPAEEIDKEVAIITNKAIAEGKPEQIISTRIVPGQIKNFYKINCLLNQEYVKDDSMTVEQYVASVAKELGCEISIVRFTRFGLGEGIEKKADDFAAEVMAQAGL
ncbi:MAG: translation elongation factor Ts [Clostridia bacterium]|nr:translation elongation factor Ts [Clostridia bacterium]